MSTTKLKIHEWAERGNSLLRRAREKLSSAASEKVRALANRIPTAVLSADNTVVLVFAGQYSAGKSTIMKALTGRQDIATGAGITTQRTYTYDWEGIRIIDSPGIHTEIRPDHDEITYRAIAEANLVVFVITNELFDSYLGQHFRKLAIEREKAHEMMLVVNKMQRCAKGNSPEAQEVIREEIHKVLVPFTPEDLRTSFIDAETAIQSKSEQDKALAEVLWRKSGFEAFTNALNEFAREKGLSGRYTTALYTLEQVLQEALSCESTGDKDIDALEELQLQRRRALHEGKEYILRAVEGEIQRVGSQIRQEGHKVAEMIHGSADQEEVNREIHAAQERVQRFSKQLDQSIQEIIGKHIKDLGERISAIANSELAKELLPRLELRFKEASISPETMSKLKKASDLSSKLGAFLVKYSFSPKAGGLDGLFKLSSYSGTEVHGALKTVGHFFGKSFKPWEAVKWTRILANVGRVISIAGIFLSIFLQWKEDKEAKQREKELMESRAAIRLAFNESAHEIEMHYDQATRSYIANTLTKDIEEVDKQVAELREMQQIRSTLFDDLRELLNETQAMIRDLHAAGPVPEIDTQRV